MTISAFDEFGEKLDPDEIKDYEFDWVLRDGETPSSFTLTQVDATGAAPVVPAVVTFTGASQYRAGLTNNYPVTFKPIVDPSITYPLVIDRLPAAEVFIRCHLVTNMGQFDKTQRLIIRQK